MAAPPVHGKLSKQGPLATLASFIHGEEDRLMFNGQQFVSLSAQSPKVITASARRTIGFDSSSEIKFAAYNNFTDLDGTFRFVNGSPTLDDNIYTGWPGTYDHIVIGYDANVSTATIKFWSKRYINPNHISIDYGYDSINFHSISGISTSWIFDDTVRHKSNEIIPQGMYVYTVSLGSTYTAKYWRIKGFLTAVVQSKVSADISGGSINIADTTYWDSSGDVYLFAKPGIGLSEFFSSPSSKNTSYTQNSVSGDTNYIDDLEISVSTDTYHKSGYILITEDYFNAAINQSVTECLGFGYIAPFSSSYDYSSCSTSVPCYYPVTAYGSLPGSTANGDIGPHGGVVSAKLHIFYGTEVIYMTDASYESTNGTSLQTITVSGYSASDDLPAGTIVQSKASLDIAQVQVKEEVSPIMRFWETDGAVCTAKEVDIDNAYDAVYDKADEVYYVAEFSSTGGSGYGMSDDFSTGDTSSTFDSDRWTPVGSAFTRDNDTECAVFENTISGTIVYGNLVSNGYHKTTSDFLDTFNVNVTTLSGNIGYIGIAARDKDTNNQLNGVFALGDWSPLSLSSFIGVEMYSIQDGSDGDAALRNFRFDPRNVPEDLCEHKLIYESDVWKYYRTSKEASPTVSDISDKDLGDTTHISEDGFVASLDKNPDIKEGSYISFFTKKNTSSPSSSNVFQLKIKYTSSSNVMEAGFNDGTDTYLTGSAPEATDIRSDILGYTDNYTTVSSTGFIATGPEDMDIPCLRVRVFDNDGDVTTVSGVTDVNGVVLGSFDVLRDYGVVYGDYYDKISIATTGQSVDIGGSIFLRVGSDLYKYNKATLPLISYENGSNAVVLTSGTVPETGVYNFAYDEYTLGGLSYAMYDYGREGVFMKVIDDNNLENTSYETELNLSSVAMPLAWDVQDMDVLYVIDGSDVYAFNTDEDSVAFANVSIADSVLPANSSEQTVVTAYASNLYGDPLSNKRVYFAITSGGGSISPASACTTSSGTASVTFTSATVSGTSIITVTASNDAC